jgi:hypothetical protein
MRANRKYFSVLMAAWFFISIFISILGCTQKPTEKIISQQEFIFKESYVVDVHHAERAFDKNISPDSFWESIKFPIWLQIEFKGNKSKKISKYSLQAGEETKRMPKDWQFQGSNDGTTWKDLDVQKNQITWKTNEERTYVVASSAAYEFYRFYFTAGNQPEILRIYEIKFFE